MINYHESSDRFDYPKKSLLKSSYQKIYLPKFSYPQKILKSKISNPKLPFGHPCHLKSGVPPPLGCQIGTNLIINIRFLIFNHYLFIITVYLFIHLIYTNFTSHKSPMSILITLNELLTSLTPFVQRFVTTQVLVRYRIQPSGSIRRGEWGKIT